MSKSELQDLVNATGDLATLPGTVVQLLDLLRDTTCAASRIVKVLEKDPAMTANILKLSNSAFYGARRRIASVHDALVMLGNRSVVTLAFATGMVPILRRDLLGYGIARQDFWDHALITATASAAAAERLGAEHQRCEAFTAGLVHDLGMLVLDTYLVANQISLENANPAWTISQVEREVLGFDHAEAGALLGEHWGFPDVLIAAIRHHHEGSRKAPHRDIVRAVMAGDLLADVVLEGLDPAADPARATLASLGCDAGFIAQLRLDIAEDLDQTVARATRPKCQPV